MAELGEAGRHAVAGWKLLMALEWEAAELAYTRVVELEPQDVEAMFGRGTCVLEQGRFAEAAEIFRATLALDDGLERTGSDLPRLDWFDNDPAYKLGNALHAMGNLEEAVIAYDESARRNCVGFEQARELVRCLIALGRGQDALDALARMERHNARLAARAEVSALRAEAAALL